MTHDPWNKRKSQSGRDPAPDTQFCLLDATSRLSRQHLENFTLETFADTDYQSVRHTMVLL